MLIVYQQSGAIVSISGVRPNGRMLSDDEKIVVPAEPLPPGQSEYHITDEKIMDQVFAALSVGAAVELLRDVSGSPTRVKVYASIVASSVPNPAAVNATVTAAATLPDGTPDTSATFQVEGGTIYTEPVTAGQASHAYAFGAVGRYRIAVSSAHHGTTVVEVVVE